ncbi:hypothetical protein B0H12DRAFT_1159635 [Mycena haematopus]|nr:hypothetical protein B0H12DRAFT_1159635 [Mycena haematopus]
MSTKATTSKTSIACSCVRSSAAHGTHGDAITCASAWSLFPRSLPSYSRLHSASSSFCDAYPVPPPLTCSTTHSRFSIPSSRTYSRSRSDSPSCASRPLHQHAACESQFFFLC